MPDLLVSTILLRARKECKTLWPNDYPNDFVFISIGTGLGNLARNVTTSSIVTERHAATLVKPMTEKISVDLRTEGKALFIMRYLLAISLETQDAHDKLSLLHSKVNSIEWTLHLALRR